MPIDSQISKNGSLKENKEDLIKSKIGQNVQFTEENESKQDFNMVAQILKDDYRPQF